MDLRNWIVSDALDIQRRLQSQVLNIVPTQLRDARPGGGNSINWGLFHITTHAELALATLDGSSISETVTRHHWAGLEENEPDWSGELDPDHVQTCVVGVASRIAGRLEQLPLERLDDPIDVADALVRAGVDVERYGWLANMWGDQTNAFLVRWPLLGHVGNHVGEMLSVRNRLGLSPF